jgi:ribitol-5-phosphate 2-dehydrogenase (NADP+) / D-ribitol-5-phosphate cytidylyltransferase
MRKVYAIILAAGNGERAGFNVPKQFIKVAGKTLLEHTIEKFEKNNSVDEILIVSNPRYRHLIEEIVLKNSYHKVSKILNGGKSRKESSYIGINSIENNDDIVLIHDAVRPFIDDYTINKCVSALNEYQAIDVAIPSSDTIIKVTDDMIIKDIPTRKYMYRGQTPQGFRVGLLKQAHELSVKDNDLEFTDDCGLVLKYGLADIYVVRGEEHNMKITYSEDIYMADKLFQLNSYFISDDIVLDSVKDKVVVIFGASKGIGLSVKKVAEENGAKVYGFSRENGTNVASFSNVKDALEQVYKIEGKIDFVVNTAGVLKMGKLETRHHQEIVDEININYLGSINVVKASLKYLKNSKGSLTLFTSSSYTRGRALYSLYSSTKAGIVNLVQALAEELLPDGIRINAINPERTSTPMRWENFGQEPEDTLLTSETVARATIGTLLSDLTGQVIDVRRKNN